MFLYFSAFNHFLNLQWSINTSYCSVWCSDFKQTGTTKRSCSTGNGWEAFEWYLTILDDEKSLHAKVDARLCNCYNEAKNSVYIFKADIFEGSGLFLSGTEDLKIARNKVLKNLWGNSGAYWKKEEENQIQSISVFKPTNVCKKNRLMVGTVRFVNHSDDPNCDYVISEKSGQKCANQKIAERYFSWWWIAFVFRCRIFWQENILWMPSCQFHDVPTEVVNNRSDNCEFRLLNPVQVNVQSVLRQTGRRRFSMGGKLTHGFINLVQPKLAALPSLKRMTVLLEVVIQYLWRRKGTINDEAETSSFVISTTENSFVPELELDDLSKLLVSSTFRSPSEVSSSETEDESIQISAKLIEDFLYCVSATIPKHATPDSEVNDWLKWLRLVDLRNFLDAKFCIYGLIIKQSSVFYCHLNFSHIFRL